MRPRRKVLLLAADELQLSRWRFLLDVHRYHVLSALSMAEALRELDAAPDCSLVLTLVAREDWTSALVRRTASEGSLKVLLADVPAAQALGSMASAVLPRQPNLHAEVLDRLRILGARQRGPKKPVRIHVELLRSAAAAPACAEVAA